MTLVHCHIAPETIPPTDTLGTVHVYLYGSQPVRAGTGSIGNQANDVLLRLGVAPRTVAVDFLSIALAVTAADTFVRRSDADDSWARDLDVRVPLFRPQTWEPVRVDIERTLRFLTGDTWRLHFEGGGKPAPSQLDVNSRRRHLDISKVDFVSLFSGGLDSGVATLEALRAGERPLLVSHAYRGDADYQDTVAALLPSQPQRFALNAHPEMDALHDDSMRSRSFNFLALGVLAADTASGFKDKRFQLRVPENGLIALNPPLTPRRIGSHSTRTTHPHYLASVQRIIDQVGLQAEITNPYETMTKGEMVAKLSSAPAFEAFASATVSCGKWKRANQQCGRCVPCLIRRASLYAGNVDDKTSYTCPDLQAVLADEDNRDDLLSMMTAVVRSKANKLSRWVAQTGPMPVDVARRAALDDVVRRGLGEVAVFLRDSGLKV
ncbi:Qat anti-phage system QueC-like protein QatC [Caulobacter sp. Root487D2Y]|uniref:Qat anti-phage system QueC-like protein QatC n=1 Tax=Caulobacter sp. Root487D2Y TaxID=1736547 RepID=UPI000B214BA7|nr:Qat anti-phage system QueC-like protein QatC [Caulobacter sp. Root487D2Y]